MFNVGFDLGLVSPNIGVLQYYLVLSLYAMSSISISSYLLLKVFGLCYIVR